MPFTNAEKQRRFRARLLADPHKAAEYKMKCRQWRKKKEDGRHVSVVQHVTNYETLQKTVQHVRREREPFTMVKGQVALLPFRQSFYCYLLRKHADWQDTICTPSDRQYRSYGGAVTKECGLLLYGISARFRRISTSRL